jgi:hypothetical protein
VIRNVACYTKNQVFKFGVLVIWKHKSKQKMCFSLLVTIQTTKDLVSGKWTATVSASKFGKEEQVYAICVDNLDDLPIAVRNELKQHFDLAEELVHAELTFSGDINNTKEFHAHMDLESAINQAL